MSKSRVVAYIYLTIVAVIWGAAGPVIKYTLGALPPVIFLAVRFFLTSVVLVPILLVKKHKLPGNLKDWGMLLFVGFLGSTANLGLLFWGFDKTSALEGSLLSDLGPVFVVVGGVLLLKEVISRRELAGLGIVVAGTALTVLQPILAEGAFAREHVAGNLLVIAANLVWVGYVLLSKRALAHRYSPLTITTISFLVGWATLFPVAIYQTGSVGQLIRMVREAPMASQAGVWFMGLLSGALAYVLYQEGQRRIEASEATLFSYLSPVFAIPLAVFWLKEVITLPYILGAGIIAAGVVVAETGRRRH